MKVPRSKLVYREKQVLRICAGRSVLHLGCAVSPYTRKRIESGRHLHLGLARVAGELVGVDLDAPSLALLEEHVPADTLFCHDVEKRFPEALARPFDVVLAGELLEHLERPGDFLENVKRAMGPNSVLLVTTPNAFSVKKWLHFCMGNEAQNPTHVMVHTPATISALLRRHEFDPIRWYGAMVVQPSRRSRLLVPIVGAFAALFPRFADCIMVEAALKNRERRAGPAPGALGTDRAFHAHDQIEPTAP